MARYVDEDNPQPIGGWLFAATGWLILALFAHACALASIVAVILQFHITSFGSDHVGSMAYVIIAGRLLAMVSGLVTLSLFFKRKRLVRAFMAIFCILTILEIFFEYFLITRSGASLRPTGFVDTLQLTGSLLALAGTPIVLACFLSLDRPRQTFTR